MKSSLDLQKTGNVRVENTNGSVTKGSFVTAYGVEVTRAKVRRERMGHIELKAPVSHIWYFKGIPFSYGIDLGYEPSYPLEKSFYFAAYVVIDPKDTPLEHKSIMTEREYRERLREIRTRFFVAKMGAGAIQDLLETSGFGS